MTAKELIEVLEELEPETRIAIAGNDGSGFDLIESYEVVEIVKYRETRYLGGEYELLKYSRNKNNPLKVLWLSVI